VDDSQFDALTQRLASIRLTRKGALRGLVGSVATLAGGAAFAGRVEAGKKKLICHCGDAGPTCAPLRLKKKQRKSHLRDHQCDYLGACRTGTGGITACAAAPIIVDVGRLGGSCSPTNPCGANSGLRCVLNICVPIDLGDVGDPCTNNGECSTGRCGGAVDGCIPCPLLSTCGSGTTAQCCAIGYHCDTGNTDVCVLD